MRERPDFAEAVRIKNRLRSEAWDEKSEKYIPVNKYGNEQVCHFIQQSKNGKETLKSSTGKPSNRHRVDPATGWRWYSFTPQRQVRHGGDPMGLHQAGMSTEGRCSQGFRLQAIATPVQATEGVHTTPHRAHCYIDAHANFSLVRGSRTHGPRMPSFVSLWKGSLYFWHAMSHAQPKLLDLPLHARLTCTPFWLFPSQGDSHCDPRSGAEFGRLAEQPLFTSYEPNEGKRRLCRYSSKQEQVELRLTIQARTPCCPYRFGSWWCTDSENVGFTTVHTGERSKCRPITNLSL